MSVSRTENLKELRRKLGSGSNFEDVMMGVQKKCKDANETTINAEIFKKINKDVLCEWLEEVWGICDRARITSVSARRTLNRVR